MRVMAVSRSIINSTCKRVLNLEAGYLRYTALTLQLVLPTRQ